MKNEIADVVISLNGRDKGKRFLIITAEEDGYSSLADGKARRLEKPKRKKSKHIKPEGKLKSQVADKLKAGEKVTNNEIRRALAEYTTELLEKGGM